MQNYKVGLYLRLSRDDNNSSSESMSISNQRILLTDYVNERGWDIEEVYIDDGISGVTFERPGFKRMIKDIENKLINMVITKDLSRFGRNYVVSGQYLDYFFPKHNVRYIAINENYDSNEENDIIAFHNIFSEHYAKDISRKVKSVKTSQMKKGQFIGSYPPMGYIRDPLDKHTLIIDEDAATVIRRIFHLYALGNSARHIADTLNSEGVLSPRDYYFSLTNRPNPFTKDANKWGSATIMSMLGSQVYIGHMCQGKRQKKTFKMQRRDVIPKDKWVIVKNKHEPLIDEITWDRVQTILKNKKHNLRPKMKKDKTVALFSSKLICADCGGKMTYTYSKNGHYKTYYKYRCSTYNNQGKTACSYHSILEDELEAIVLNEIQKFSKIAIDHSEKLLNAFQIINSKMKLKNNSQAEKQIHKTERELQSIVPKIDVLLDQMANGNISETMFKKLMTGYEEKQTKLNQQLIIQKSELANEKEDTKNIENLINMFKDRVYIVNLDRETVVELIDYIEVFKKEKIGNEYLQRIDIYFNFIGKISSDNFDILKDYMNDIDKNNPKSMEIIV